MKRSRNQRKLWFNFLSILVSGICFWPMKHGAVAFPAYPPQIPAGEFEMGTLDGTEEERPVHKVWLDSFSIDNTEVTNRDYEKFRPNHRRSLLSSCEKCPVTLVTWFEADAYCRKQRGGRLPTEAEWEKAARGPKRWNYSFGPVPDLEKGHFGKSFKTGAVKVYSPKKREYGINHMSGNVWEWAADWFGSYPKGPVKNPKGPGTGFQKVVRGGSWYSPAYYIHVGRRFKLAPNVALNSIGFRCAYDIQETQ